MKHAVILLALLAAVSASADGIPKPTTAGLHLVSVHDRDNHRWNNDNPGAYARWDSGFIAGTYRNSLRNQTVYAGWSIADDKDRFALMIGVFTGYAKFTKVVTKDTIQCDSPSGYCIRTRTTYEQESILTLGIVPSVRIGLGGIGLDDTSMRLSAVLPPKSAKALHLSVERGF
ncbi:hypothetical protein [Ramlibacter tataouinensis]|uniref:Uncharacterized protein n=1 Tax=Ramlibacter tataouinensis (strain ATCC BAA-407 / DSM 14655 / LMG 21543 / TTB310) TaxID=365046 RepID=F5Y6I7_RAMTT|nr:hypothetical protein [Ramlibacter tataouinensis]AEG94061.1 hypothetical protein Rta_29580 [Ramlibacter tataouinensis TTB310]